jgi:uncharacterized membrane protein YdbT with pleckstrin-like domain
MTTYVEGTLIKGENIVYTGKVSLWSMTPLIILSIPLLFLFGLGLILWVIAFIKYKSTELAFTDKRVIAKFGLISRQTIELNVNKVESVQVIQSMLGRLFNYGTLVISGAGAPQAPIPGISEPMAFRRAFMESQDQAKATQ